MWFNGFAYDATLFGICYYLLLRNIWGSGVFDGLHSNLFRISDLTILKLEYVDKIKVFWEGNMLAKRVYQFDTKPP